MLRAECPCPDVKNYKWHLNPVWHCRMLYSCTHMATVGIKGLMSLLVSLSVVSWSCCSRLQFTVSETTWAADVDSCCHGDREVVKQMKALQNEKQQRHAEFDELDTERQSLQRTLASRQEKLDKALLQHRVKEDALNSQLHELQK